MVCTLMIDVQVGVQIDVWMGVRIDVRDVCSVYVDDYDDNMITEKNVCHG